MATMIVENSNPNGNIHSIENNGKVLPIIATPEFSTSCKQLAEVSGKSVEAIVEEILHGGLQLKEKNVFEHCDVVITEFTDGKVSKMRGFKNKNKQVAS